MLVLFLLNSENAYSRYKLHPRVTRSELYEVFKTRGCHKIRNIILRCASGAGVTVIPEKDMTDQDRCYASVEIKGFEGAWAALKGWWKSTNPPELHGLPVYIGLTASEMPEAAAILKNITRSLLRNVHQAEYVVGNRLFAPPFTDERSEIEAPKSASPSPSESLCRKRNGMVRVHKGHRPDLPGMLSGSRGSPREALLLQNASPLLFET